MDKQTTSTNKHCIVTLATLITSVRIILIPFIVMNLVAHAWKDAFILILIAALTDLFDGALARYRGETTWFGACLDPVADKLLLLSLFGTLAYMQAPYHLPLWFFWILLCKEVVQIGSVVYLYAIGSYFVPRPIWTGKISTALQIGILLLFLGSYVFTYQWEPSMFITILLSISVGMSILSYVQYILAWYRQRFKHEGSV